MSSPIRVFVVDDEEAAREELKFLLDDLPGVEVVGEAASAREALSAIPGASPDLAFVDIRMPGASGLDVARRLQRTAPDTAVIFATAYDEHAVAAFDLDATDYVLKPFEADRVARAVDRARRRRRDDEARPPVSRLMVSRRHRSFVLDVSQILWIGTESGLVTVVGVDGTHYGSNLPLREIEAGLDSRRFHRCHRRVIVNLDHVRELVPAASGTYRVVMGDEAGTSLPVARKRVPGVKRALGS